MTAVTEPWPDCLADVLYRAHTLDSVASGMAANLTLKVFKTQYSLNRAV
jgi:hypothetical protein